MNLLIKRFTQPFVSKFKPTFFFSISNQQMVEMHEAILASRIIERIKQKKIEETEEAKQQNRVYQSLRGEVIQMIKEYLNTQKEETSSSPKEAKDSLQTAKNNMLKYFDGGVWVDDDLCIQSRFFSEVKASQTNNANSNQISQKVEIKNPGQESQIAKKKLTFCPTYLVTGEIFRTIIQEDEYLLITGHFGIGKTYSFMLYHLLSDRIYRYLHNYCKQGNEIPKEINRKLPKLVYWTINMKQFRGKGKQFLDKIIAKQCYQYAQVEKGYHFFQYDASKQNLHSFYLKRGIHLRLIVDQINVIASAFRNFNNLNSLSKQLRETIPINNPRIKPFSQQLNQQIQKIVQQQFPKLQKIKKRYNLAKELHEMVQTLRDKFGRALFLSSKDIEQSVMGQLDLNGQGNHEKIFRKTLKYQRFSKDPQNLTDLAEFFVCLLEINFKKFNEKDLTQNQIKTLSQIKKIVFERLKGGKLHLFPITIRLIMFQDKQPLSLECSQIIQKMLNQKMTQDQLNKNVDKIIGLINGRLKEQLRAFLDIFLKKSESSDFKKVQKEKYILLLKLLYEAKAKMIQRDSNTDSGYLVLDASKILNQNSNVSQEQVSNSLSRNLAYYNGRDGKFYFIVDQKILKQILQQKESTLLKALSESNVKIYSIIDTQVNKGLFIESLIRHCLSVRNTQLTLKIQSSNQIKEFLPISASKQMFFQSIPSKGSTKNFNDYSFLTAFQNALKQNFLRCFFFLPTKYNGKNLNLGFETNKELKIDEVSKKIDFVLAENYPTKSNINAFDVTISMQAAQDKISEFFYEFSNFVDKEQQNIQLSIKKNVQLNYFVFVSKLPQKAIQWVEKINKAITQLKTDKVKLKDKTESQLKKSKKSQEEKKNLRIQSQIQMQRLDKRIEFLQNLSRKENLLQSKYELEIKRSSTCKTLLTNVAIVSLINAQITNDRPGQISFYKGLLERAKEDMKNR